MRSIWGRRGRDNCLLKPFMVLSINNFYILLNKFIIIIPVNLYDKITTIQESYTLNLITNV